MGTEESERGPKRRQTKEAGCKGKIFFFKQKKKRHETILKGMSSEMQARPGGGKICVIFLKSRFTSMLVLILILVLLSHPFQITARVAREDQTSRGVLFIFYHPPIHWGGKGKGGVRGSHTGRLGGRKGEEKQNNLLFPPPLSGWICRSLTNYKHTRTLVCNRCTCNCSSCCTWTVERGSRRWEQLWGKQKSWRAHSLTAGTAQRHAAKDRAWSRPPSPEHQVERVSQASSSLCHNLRWVFALAV